MQITQNAEIKVVHQILTYHIYEVRCDLYTGELYTESCTPGPVHLDICTPKQLYTIPGVHPVKCTPGDMYTQDICIYISEICTPGICTHRLSETTCLYTSSL